MKRLLILGGLAAGAFLAWRKFSASRQDEDLEEDLYGSPSFHEHADAPAATPS